jgi:hypothetical protein
MSVIASEIRRGGESVAIQVLLCKYWIASSHWNI